MLLVNRKGKEGEKKLGKGRKIRGGEVEGKKREIERQNKGGTQMGEAVWGGGNVGELEGEGRE